MIDVFLDVKPTPKARPRLKKFGSVYTPKKTAIAERAVHILVMHYMIENRIHITDRPIALQITFCYKYRKGTKDADKLLPMYFCKRPDIDNLAKLVMDAMNGLVYEDDAQVVKLRCEKVYHEKDGIHLRVIKL